MQQAGIKTLAYDFSKTGFALPKPKEGLGRETLLLPLIAALSLFYLTVIMAPIYAIFRASGGNGIIPALLNPGNISAIKLSLLTTSLTTVSTFIIGTPVAFLLRRKDSNIFYRIFGMLVNLPLVLPPAVAGLGLLLAFGRNGPAGLVLGGFNVEVVFTPFAVVVAQFFVSSGFYIQALKAGVDEIAPEIFEASYTLGAGNIETYLRVIVPMLKRHITAGLILSWTRALGEFGATIMFAGNVMDKTRTMPLQIYTLMQTDISSAAALSMVLFLISFAMLYLAKLWCRE